MAPHFFFLPKMTSDLLIQVWLYFLKTNYKGNISIYVKYFCQWADFTFDLENMRRLGLPFLYKYTYITIRDLDYLL
jgi:hypothetical protein